MAPKKITSKVSDNDDLKQKYQKKTQYEHIIDRPDTYIGSIKPETDKQYVLSMNNNVLVDESGNSSVDSRNVIIEKEIKNIQGIFKIYDEIMVNAIDNKNRTDIKIANGEKKLKPMTKIEVDIKKMHVDGLDGDRWGIMVKNDGEGIDVEIHPEEKVWIPDMIFGQLLTSSNYDDDEKKITGGKNGFGAKLTNIYSHYFCVETVDHKRKRHYKREYFNRMSNNKDAVVTEKYRKSPYTSITFVPYYEAFGIPDLTDDLIALFKKRVYDMVYSSFGNLQVFLNGVQLLASDKNTTSCEEYVKMYIGDEREVFNCNPDPRWMISVCLSDGFQFNQVSFVNGINTCRGGKHVDYVSKQICKALSEYIKSKKKVDINDKFIKDNLMIFVNSIIENPDFDGQTKETLKTTSRNFGSSFELPNDFIKTIASKSGIVERALAQNSFQETQLLKKTDGKKRNKLHINKLDDAEYAGSNKSSQCTLILTEGDSAKATAIAGISVVENGGKIFGVFPLRGKLLNTRGKSTKDIIANEEINNINQIIGLRRELDYSVAKNYATLRYGRIMIMTDQDVDGSHIKGLIINYFENNYPTLVQSNNFIVCMATPIVKVWKERSGNKANLKNFYDLPSYQAWCDSNNGGKGWKAKYYKGLGTSTKLEAKEYFMNPKIIEFNWDDNSAENIDMVFNKKRADDRKEWLAKFQNDVLDLDKPHITYTEFIDKEFIHFSMYDNVRSIPSFMDGFKPGQRKIMYSCFKRNLRSEIRVAQLAGYVSEHSGYHHGEVSLQGTIIGCAQAYTGSNNINLLVPSGQFGTRLEGGKDSAQPRYIFTKLEDITSVLYNKHDMALYTYIVDDGDQVEPVFYAPVIPMVLVNGTEGIGTGWSCNIPSFNPLDIVANIKCKIAGHQTEELMPWYRGFRGEITKLGKNKWLTKGRYRIVNKNTVEISELPIGLWTNPYKDYLNSLINPGQPATSKTASKGKRRTTSSKSKNTNSSNDEQKVLKDYTVEPSDTKINITLKLEDGVLDELVSSIDKEGISKFEKLFKLTSKVSCNNTLNFFNENNELVHFNNIDDIFNCYYDVRLQLYTKRRAYLLDELRKEYQIANYKMKFILDYINDKIKLKNIAYADVCKQLEKLEYPHMFNGYLITKNNDNYDNGDYNYLLNMRISTLTKEKVEELRKENDRIEVEIATLEAKTNCDLWLEDLAEFEKVYEQHMKEFYKANGLEAKDYENTPKKLKIKFLKNN